MARSTALSGLYDRLHLLYRGMVDLVVNESTTIDSIGPSAPAVDPLQARGSLALRLATIPLFWLLFFSICFGLGYPTLNRYDPRTAGNLDSAHYYDLVVGNPSRLDRPFSFRILVPTVAKPIYWIARDRVATWDAVLLSLLIVNSAFMAAATLIVVWLGWKSIRDPVVPLLGGALFLLNFATSNEHLAGLVDSAEALFISVLALFLFQKWWYLVPALGALGALGKETSVTLGAVFAIAWWLASVSREGWRIRELLCALGVGTFGLATVLVLQSVELGMFVLPTDVIEAEASNGSYIDGLVHWITDRTFWYHFVWLIPLGGWKLGELPRSWVAASLAAAATALHLGAYASIGGNVGRPVFSVAGPVLSLSAALLLVTLARVSTSGGNRKSSPRSPLA